MEFAPITIHDLDEIRHLKPEGWYDIVPDFQFYLNTSFCFPIKAIIDKKIVGIGVNIIFENTSWLAQIIVLKEFRNRGIGSQIVERLLNNLKSYPVTTSLLIATELGKPVYEKAGFRTVTEYSVLKKEEKSIEYTLSKNIKTYSKEYYKAILDLDRKASGENREKLISNFLSDSILYIEKNELKGYYIPSYKEGLILADTYEAGIELMKLKFSKADKAVLPSDNTEGIAFLKQNGFVELPVKNTRMILGETIPWKANKIFSRIGGNLG